MPREHPDASYKFLVFSRKPEDSSYEVTFVDESDEGGAGNFFIHQVRISKFFNEASRRKFGAKTRDGILFADAGAKEYETDIYFWASGGYRQQPVDY